jgi:hypothetical protein
MPQDRGLRATQSEEISTVDVDWWRSQINEEWMKERTPSKVHELLKPKLP